MRRENRGAMREQMKIAQLNQMVVFLPAGNGTMMAIVLLGQLSVNSCADTGIAAISLAVATKPKIKWRRSNGIRFFYSSRAALLWP